jgi:hypothetical protein
MDDAEVMEAAPRDPPIRRSRLDREDEAVEGRADLAVALAADRGEGGRGAGFFEEELAAEAAFRNGSGIFGGRDAGRS